MGYKGLSSIEAENNLKKFGSNEIREVKTTRPIKILLRQIKNNFVVYLLFAAMILSFSVGKSITSYTILAVILLVVLTGFIQEYRAERAIKALRGMLMPVSIVIRDGKEIEIPSKFIVPGDILVLRTGEKIPADSLVLDQNELLINESVLTGESKEVQKTNFKGRENESNTIFMGTFIVSGKCLAQVVHTGMNTKFGKIAGLISETEKELPLQEKINKITKFMVVIAIVFSLLTGAIMLITNPFSTTLLVEALLLVVALAVSAFPEGFPVVLITTLATGSYKMAQKNAIVNRMSVIETLGETTIICSDKTGTITMGEMTVKKVFIDNRIISITGAGYSGEGEFIEKNSPIVVNKEPLLSKLLTSAVLCNDSRIQRKGNDSEYSVLGSPTEAALLVLGAKAKIFKDDLNCERIKEIPFTSERKSMAVLCSDKKTFSVYAKGAPEILLDKCQFIERYNGIFKLTDREKRGILEQNKKFTRDTYRTLAIAYKKAPSKDLENSNLVFLGIVAIEDPPREEIAESLRLCFKAGIKVKMITGDNKETAIAIANRINLRGKIMEGSQLDKITDLELEKMVNDIVIFARVKPEHKLKIVRALKANGEIVTMTGDGVNDAPALKEAHIGVAMGKNGTDVSREVADLTLKDDNFATIVNAIKEGRTIFKNIRKFVSYQLSCNYAELTILFLGVLLAPLFGWQIPILLALQILFMNLVTDDLPAITLSFTPYSKDVMEESPRRKESLLKKHHLIWLLIAGISMALITLAIFFVTFNILGQDFETARTTALVTLICVEIVNAYNFMSFRKIVKPSSLFVNKYLFFASIVSILATILIIYTPLNQVFETVPLEALDWIIAIALSSLIVFLFNILKIINNKKKFFKLN